MLDRHTHQRGRGVIAAAIVLLVTIPLRAQGPDPRQSPPPDWMQGKQTTTPSVLIIASYERSQSSTRGQEDAIRAEIERVFPYARVRSDYIVSALAMPDEPTDELVASLANTMRVKYRDSQFDLVVSIDALALRVLAGPGRDLLKNAPLVFTGATQDRAEVERLGLNATGVYERIDAAGTVELALKLQPDTQHVLAVSSGSQYYDRLRDQAISQLEPMRARVEIRWAKAKTAAELLDEARALGPLTAVLFIGYMDEASGIWGGRGLRVEWPVPVYGVYGSNLSMGMVGGKVVLAQAQGTEAGRMAVRVLLGESPTAIPPCVGCTNAFVVRDPMLAKWGISKSRLPPNTAVWLPLPSWFDRHRSLLAISAVGFVVEAGVIALLLMHRAARQRAEAELVAQRERYALAIQGTNDGIFDWDILRDRVHWSSRMDELLGLKPDARERERPDRAEMIHPDDLERHEAALRAHLEHNAPLDIQTRLKVVGSGYRWFRVQGLAQRDPAGKPIRMAGSISDVHDRVIAEERLRDSDARLRLALTASGAGTWSYDAITGCSDWDDRYHEMYGYEPGDARSFDRWVASIHPEDRPRVLARLQGMLGSPADNEWRMEFRAILPEGRVAWMLGLGRAERDEHGRVVRMSGLNLDITERRRTEQLLLDSEAKYRRIVETAAEGIWLVDQEWKTTFVNPTMAKMLGRTPEEMQGRHLLDFMDQQAREECARNMQRREDGVAEQHDFRLRHKDGRDVWTVMSTNPVVDDAGTFLGALAMVTDVTERRNREEALREAEERFRATFEHAAVGIVVVGMDGRYLMVNDQFVAMMGYSRQELVQMKFLDITHQEDISVSERNYADALQGRAQTYTLEKRYIRKDRSVVWAIVTPTLVRDPGGHPRYFVAILQDISGRKQVEAALRESEASYRTLLAAIPDVMFRMDKEGNYLDCHAPDPSQLVMPAEQLLGRNVRDVFTGPRRDRADMCIRALDALFATGAPQTYEYQSRQTSQPKWWEVRLVQGRPGEALMLLRDVTDRKQAELRLRESEQRLRLLVESTPLGVVYWDLQFRVAAWNAGAERIFGYSAQEAIGQHASFIVPEDARVYVDEVWRGLMSQRGGLRGTNANIRKDGAVIFCEWYNSPLIDPHGEVIGAASVVEDVTERRRAQQRQSLMMAELDHRVKNNLATVLSLAEETGRRATSYDEFIGTFNGRLRALARMHTALAQSRWHGADLRTLVTQTLRAFGSDSADRASVQGPAVILGPRTAQAVAMALNELATNAVKYGALSEKNGTVRVSWTVEQSAAGNRTARLHWVERGGPGVLAPERRGFGSELIEGTIPFEFKGRAVLKFEAEGVECEMEVPLEEPTPTAQSNGSTGAEPTGSGI